MSVHTRIGGGWTKRTTGPSQQLGDAQTEVIEIPLTTIDKISPELRLHGCQIRGHQALSPHTLGRLEHLERAEYVSAGLQVGRTVDYVPVGVVVVTAV